MTNANLAASFLGKLPGGYIFHTCDNPKCGKAYEPKRLPRADRMNFCPDCQPDKETYKPSVSNRMWKARARAKKQGKRNNGDKKKAIKSKLK